jgi:hypothetical protein
MCVGVKKGATTLTRTPSRRETDCEARDRPTTPCLEDTYETTPVPPKYPDVEAMSTIEPRAPSESGGFDFIECIAIRRAIRY